MSDEKEKVVTIGALTRADVVIRIADRIYGSLPKNADLLTEWIASKAGKSPQEGGPVGDEDTLAEKLEALMLAEEGDDRKVEPGEVVEEEERVSCGFRTVAHGKDAGRVLCMRDFQLKAAIGQAAQVTKLTTKVRGARPTLREGLQIRPQHIPLVRDGHSLLQADGVEDFIGHVTTMRGRRSILKRCDYAEQVELSFSVFWVPGIVTADHLYHLIDFTGVFLGIGSQRRFEAGKFDLVSYKHGPSSLAEIRAFDRIEQQG